MLAGVSPMQTEARCAQNHKKPGSSAACVPASSPHALKFGRKNLRCPASVCKTDRSRTHTLQICQRAGTSKRQSNQKPLEKRVMEGPQGLSPRILLHCHDPGM